MDLAKIRQAVVDVLDVDTATVHVYATVPDAPTTPCIIVYPSTPFTYSTTYDGKLDFTLIVWCLTGTVNSDTAQTQIDSWISTGTPDSFIDALALSEDLNGTVDSSKFQEVRSYGSAVLQDGGTRYISAEIVLDIYA